MIAGQVIANVSRSASANSLSEKQESKYCALNEFKKGKPSRAVSCTESVSWMWSVSTHTPRAASGVDACNESAIARTKAAVALLEDDVWICILNLLDNGGC